MNEYPDISLDRFDFDNLISASYFLSHCHADHMEGLDAPEFESRLTSHYPNIKLYCHDVTAGLLLAIPRFSLLRRHLVTLTTDEQHAIPVFTKEGVLKYHVTVTLIPAGHSPGSVMFLFDGCEGRVLYTGDFRFHVGDVTKLR